MGKFYIGCLITKKCSRGNIKCTTNLVNIRVMNCMLQTYHIPYLLKSKHIHVAGLLSRGLIFQRAYFNLDELFCGLTIQYGPAICIHF